MAFQWGRRNIFSLENIHPCNHYPTRKNIYSKQYLPQILCFFVGELSVFPNINIPSRKYITEFVTHNSFFTYYFWTVRKISKFHNALILCPNSIFSPSPIDVQMEFWCGETRKKMKSLPLVTHFQETLRIFELESNFIKIPSIRMTKRLLWNSQKYFCIFFHVF